MIIAYSVVSEDSVDARRWTIPNEQTPPDRPTTCDDGKSQRKTATRAPKQEYRQFVHLRAHYSVNQALTMGLAIYMVHRNYLDHARHNPRTPRAKGLVDMNLLYLKTGVAP
jgi:hypothetical protein